MDLPSPGIVAALSAIVCLTFLIFTYGVCKIIRAVVNRPRQLDDTLRQLKKRQDELELDHADHQRRLKAAVGRATKAEGRLAKKEVDQNTSTEEEEHVVDVISTEGQVPPPPETPGVRDIPIWQRIRESRSRRNA